MLLRPKTFKKYQEADETHEASSETNSTPLCNIGLNLKVSGKGTLANTEIINFMNSEIGQGNLLVTKPENAQLIHPPMMSMGRTFVTFPLSISVMVLGSVIGLGAGLCLRSTLK